MTIAVARETVSPPGGGVTSPSVHILDLTSGLPKRVMLMGSATVA
jgi:hypothetical protein